MDILIVDDEALARDRLARMIDKIDDCNVVATANSSQEALAIIRQKDPEVVLLDVRMPGEDGLSCARQIAELDDAPAVIFCTAYDSYALDAFNADAIGYLVKPVKLEQLQKALAKSRQLNKAQRTALTTQPAETTQRQHISAKTLRGVDLIPLEDIRCFIAEQKYVSTYHTAGENLIDDTLKELEIEFPNQFVRIHRNALVSLQHIEGIERRTDGNTEVILAGIELRPLVSRRHAAKLREIINNL